MKKLLTIFMLSMLLVVSCTTASDGTTKVSKTGNRKRYKRNSYRNSWRGSSRSSYRKYL